MRFIVTNDQKDAITVGVEPWGDFMTLPPGDSIGVFCSDEGVGYVNVRLAPSQLALRAEGKPDMELRLDGPGESVT